MGIHKIEQKRLPLREQWILNYVNFLACILLASDWFKNNQLLSNLAHAYYRDTIPLSANFEKNIYQQWNRNISYFCWIISVVLCKVSKPYRVKNGKGYDEKFVTAQCSFIKWRSHLNLSRRPNYNLVLLIKISTFGLGLSRITTVLKKQFEENSILRPVFKNRQFSVTFLLPTFFDVAILWWIICGFPIP